MIPPFITAFFVTLGIMAIIIFFMLYKSWLSFLRPDWFYVFNIYEHNLLNYEEKQIFHKTSGKKDSYTFDKNLYDKSKIRPYINQKGIYTWNFLKGNTKPIFIYKPQENLDSKLLATTKNMNLDDIWHGSNTMEDFIRTWGLIILALVILILFAYLITQNNQTSALLQNITRTRW